LRSFNDIGKSCSNIGYAYIIPEKLDGATILAGNFTNWYLTGLEAFSLL
jgi:hypothetical protein